MDQKKERFLKNLINQLNQKKSDLEQKIIQAKERIGKAESAQVSWSDHTLTDIEDEISILSQQWNTAEIQLKEIQGFWGHKISSDKVVPGSLVTIEIDGEKQILLAINSTTGSLEQGLLSIQSPLGKALIDKKAEQGFTVPTPIEPLKVKVLKII